MITSAPSFRPQEHPQTVWGLSPTQLHDRFWAARGVQVIRLNQPTPINRHAELFLLMGQSTLAIFRLSQLRDTLNWLRPHLTILRIHDPQDHGYREQIITDNQDHFIRIERLYENSNLKLARLALSPDPYIAERWQRFNHMQKAWKQLRKDIPQNDRATSSIDGVIYNTKFSPDIQRFMHELINTWRRPDVTVSNISQHNHHVWSHLANDSIDNPRYVGPVWIGAGRQLNNIDSVVGPAVLWDEPKSRPHPEELRWDKIVNPVNVKEFQFNVKPRKLTSLQRFVKRTFDLLFASFALIITLPIFPMVMLAIWIEDGRPFFFTHKRETRAGKEFPCIKFRSMRNNAEQIKKRLQEENVSDGPHFFIEKDPRHTVTGRIIRKLNIDELPQFFNVLLGHMSIVGPRPSPYSENQYCPPWREARLSVRPGITGMWQVYRSREDGLDFQEWIKYDLEYVEKMSFFLDLKLVFLTAKQILHIA